MGSGGINVAELELAANSFNIKACRDQNVWMLQNWHFELYDLFQRLQTSTTNQKHQNIISYFMIHVCMPLLS